MFVLLSLFQSDFWHQFSLNLFLFLFWCLVSPHAKWGMTVWDLIFVWLLWIVLDFFFLQNVQFLLPVDRNLGYWFLFSTFHSSALLLSPSQFFFLSDLFLLCNFWCWIVHGRKRRMHGVLISDSIWFTCQHLVTLCQITCLWPHLYIATLPISPCCKGER